jgi:hypothetical protein
MNLSHTQLGELWPVLYLYAKGLYYIVAVVSMLEEVIDLGKSLEINESNKELIKLTMEEKSQNIVVTFEYL